MRALVLADRDTRDLERVLARERPDVVITLGDLDATFLSPLRSFAGPRLGVYGNHCDGVYLEQLGMVNLHGRAGKMRGISLAGMEGCPRYKPGPLQYEEHEVQRVLAPLPQVDVMVCHTPPRGVNDEPRGLHQGFQALRDYVDRHPPRMLMHGHTGPTEPVTRLGDTQVVYVCGWAMVDLPASAA